MASELTTRNVTAMLPYYGAVSWTHSVLDAKAAEWERAHRPVGGWWQVPLFKDNDTRRCSECPGTVFWSNCEFALWARFWRVTQIARGGTPSLAQLRGTVTG